MSEYDGFLAAIIAAPDDDMPRLIAADFLDENGEPERAEFVRVQIAMVNGSIQERLPDPRKHTQLKSDLSWQSVDDCGNCPHCRRRESELLWRSDCPPGVESMPRQEWVPGLADMLGHSHGRWRFRRGFVSEITCSWADWLKHHAAILAACPIRRILRGSTNAPIWRGDGLARLTTMPMVGQDIDILTILAADYPGVVFELPRHVAM